MITEDKKYRAEVFKICGIALMSPMGRFVLGFLEKGLQDVDIQFFIDLAGSFILFCFGIIVIQVGYEITQGLGD